MAFHPLQPAFLGDMAIDGFRYAEEDELSLLGTPFTKSHERRWGTRYSLVGWAHGPAFG